MAIKLQISVFFCIFFTDYSIYFTGFLSYNTKIDFWGLLAEVKFLSLRGGDEG